MPNNIGTQSLYVKFFDPVDSPVANGIGKNVRKTGIYTGGYLTKSDDVTVILSPLECEIGDGTYQLRALTADNVNVTVAVATPYVVLRWLYTGSAADDYIDFKAVALGGILTNDLVVGKCTFSGATLTGFDYSYDTTNRIWNRSTPLTADLFLKVEPTVPASMYVRVRAGRISNGTVNYDIADQNSPLLVAPGANSYICAIQINNSGVVIATYGSTSATPTPPVYGGLTTLAEIKITNGDTTIIASAIKDVRNHVAAGGGSITNLLPSQAGNAGKSLVTDGSVASWDYGTYAP